MRCDSPRSASGASRVAVDPASRHPVGPSSKRRANEPLPPIAQNIESYAQAGAGRGVKGGAWRHIRLDAANRLVVPDHLKQAQPRRCSRVG